MAEGLITSHASDILYLTVGSRLQTPLQYRVVFMGQLRRSQRCCLCACCSGWMVSLEKRVKSMSSRCDPLHACEETRMLENKHNRSDWNT